eukprot:SAG31_NODE_2400_length_5775_cov_2.602185_6_plen_134_part_00
MHLCLSVPDRAAARERMARTSSFERWSAADGAGSPAPGGGGGGALREVPFGVALRQLGVGAHQHNGSITAQEKAELDTEGFVVLHDLFAPEQAGRMLAESRRLGAVDGGSWRWVSHSIPINPNQSQSILIDPN